MTPKLGYELLGGGWAFSKYYLRRASPTWGIADGIVRPYAGTRLVRRKA